MWGVIDNEVILIDRGIKIEESVILFQTFEGGKGDHGSSAIDGGKHEYAFLILWIG